VSTEADIHLLGATRYKPVGCCIYCGASEGALTDEHIVPYALNGNWVLPKASCKKCEGITGWVEQQILRGELLHLRAALAFQTRRPSERPSTVSICADDRNVEVPISDCPIVMPFIRFPIPGLLDARPSKIGIDAIGTIGIRCAGPEPEEFAKRYGFRKLSFQRTLAPAFFARMISKIAYSHAVARFGPSALVDEFVTDIILGKSERIGDIVGCVSSDLPAPQFTHEHVLRPAVYKGGLSGEERLLTVQVKLFAGLPTPVYEVVLGRPAEWLENVERNYHAI
jgi:hypothetical protein